MKSILESLSKSRDFLTKNCKNINTGKSPVFVFVSLISGIAIVIVSALLASKTMIGRIGMGVGSLTAIVNAIQLIYRKYICLFTEV